MPPTVAPPPRTGEAAQGPGTAGASAATDRAATPHDTSAAEPAHPLPVAAARTAATGTLITLFSAAVAGLTVLIVLVVRMATSGAEHLETGGPSLVLLVIGFALANAAALLLLTRGWTRLRPTTLLLATIAAVAWPLSGHAWIAAPVAIVVVGLLVARDHRVPGGLRVTGTAGAVALTLIALFTAIAGAVTSPTKDRDRNAARGDVAGVTATSETALEETPTAEPEATETAAPEREPQATPEPEPKAAETPAPAEDPEPAEAPAGTPAQDSDPAATPAPDDAAAPSPAPPSPTSFVRAYYRDLDAQRFDAAWDVLSPAVQATLGPYARWKAGYADTTYSRPREFTIEGDGSARTVTHILVARDKGCDGERQFKVTWQLRGDGDRWVVTSLGAVALGSGKC